MEANFYEPGDYITYIVTVSNLGTLDATLDSIKLNMYLKRKIKSRRT